MSACTVECPAAQLRGFVVLVLVAAGGPAAAQERASGFADPLLGRWDLTVEGADAPYPSWLEVRLRTEGTLMAQFVGRIGSARYVESVDFHDGRLVLRVPAQYEPGARELELEARLAGGRLEGTLRGAGDDAPGRDGRLRWIGERAPALVRGAEHEAGEPFALFDGRGLSGWRARDGAAADCWHVETGVLAATPPCVDLVTEREFDDFALHAEFQYPPGSNSGIYLRGRYEVQIQDDWGKALDSLRMGAIYGFLAPSADAARAAGEWQALDVTLRGRRVSVVLNGITIVDDREIPGITGGALDSREGAPGPIMLQGDHGAIRFRNLTLTPLR